MIPIILRLKRESHKEVAKAQDMVVESLYEVFNDAVLHGGTSIWRCYQGNRFSEDIDVYLPKDIEKIGRLFELLKRRGCSVEKRRVKENSLYSSVKLNDTVVRFEALFKNVKGHLKEYETAEGNFITINTLTPEELIKEKVATYLKRQKVRDMYDVFFLLRYVSNMPSIKRLLEGFLANFKKPVDEKDLKILLSEGVVPSPQDMLEYIKRKL